MINLIKLISPIAPHISEKIYQNLKDYFNLKGVFQFEDHIVEALWFDQKKKEDIVENLTDLKNRLKIQSL